MCRVEGLKMETRGNKTRHDENLNRLARVEGQIRGIRRMIEEGAYCIDILTQLQAAQAGMAAVVRRIIRKHVGSCVMTAIRRGGERERKKKIEEIMTVIKRTVG